MSTVDYEVKNKIGYITLSRPDKLNAINVEMRQELGAIFDDVRDNPDVWLAIITGKGRAFCTGHDLTDMAEGAHVKPTSDELYLMESRIWKPILAAVNGVCLAQGCGLALSADLRVASNEARFGWPQAKRGISSVSGPTLLAHRIPQGIALELLFTGRFLAAEEALGLGLVNRLVPPDKVMEETEALAQEILANAPLAVRTMKEVTIRGLEMNMEDRLKYAAEHTSSIRETADAQEGLAAFREKRAPVWRAE